MLFQNAMPVVLLHMFLSQLLIMLLPCTCVCINLTSLFISRANLPLDKMEVGTVQDFFR